MGENLRVGVMVRVLVRGRRAVVTGAVVVALAAPPCQFNQLYDGMVGVAHLAVLAAALVRVARPTRTGATGTGVAVGVGRRHLDCCS